MSSIDIFTDKNDEQTLINADTGRRKKEQYIESLKEKDQINDLFAVARKNPPRPYKKGIWFDFLATDKTGSILVKYWGGENKDRVKRLYDSFTVGDVVQIRSGYVEIYDEKPQISVNESTGGIRRCSKNEYDMRDFVPSLSEERIQELMDIIKKEINTINTESLRRLLDSFFNDKGFIDAYKTSPSAMTHHHNYLGGNLEHVVSVIKLCHTISDMYPGINKDLLITGALLHDIGKLKEYTVKASIDKTEEGNFIGHIVLGDRWIKERIETLRGEGYDFPRDTENQISHLILSHHGRYEWGSPRLPITIEACILHYADLMDSQIKNYMQNIEEAKRISDDDWGWIYDSDLGKRRAILLRDY
ncbi:MAG: HD domain-containing protein [Candidatus Thermoplasmatota archaeon]